MSAVIEVAGLSKHYGSMQAVRDVSLALDENRIHGLLGRNLEHLGGSALRLASPTTSPAGSSKTADSDPSYTLECNESLNGGYSI